MSPIIRKPWCTAILVITSGKQVNKNGASSFNRIFFVLFPSYIELPWADAILSVFCFFLRYFIVTVKIHWSLYVSHCYLKLSLIIILYLEKFIFCYFTFWKNLLNLTILVNNGSSQSPGVKKVGLKISQNS